MSGDIVPWTPLPAEALTGKEVTATGPYFAQVKSHWLSDAYWTVSNSIGKRVATIVAMAALGNLGMVVVGGMFLGLVTTFTIGSPVPHSMYIPANIGLPALGAELTVGTLIPTIAAPLYTRKSRRRFEAATSLEMGSLKSWLADRYGVIVSDEVLAKLTGLVHEQRRDIQFKDVHGTALKMIRNSGGWLVLEDEEPKPLTDYRPAGSVAEITAESSAKELQAEAEVDPVTLLRGEAPVLHEALRSLLHQLHALDLNVEQKHVVNRVQQDMASTLTMLRKADKLGGPSDEQQAQIVAIFGLLIQELQDLLQGERDDLTSDLQVQRAYVAQRRRQVSSSSLALPTASSIEQDEVHEAEGVEA